MKAKVAIIDYGMGNLYSVRNSFKSLGMIADIIEGPEKIFSYDKLILPGVGAFGDAMEELTARGFIEPLRDFISAGRPFLGICLGMQLLMEKSEESRGIKGLAVIKGQVRKFSSKLKCPHMGWNKIEKVKKGLKIFKGLGQDVYAYFCHSYYVLPRSRQAMAGRTDYGIKFASVIKEGNVYGMQFHPEKSQEAGLKLLRNFIELC
ncbi:MAG TPA: imidazole glycerol phosphate synthase subunit HisH [Candidatus Omnitrophica bacterium]|nr:imidazole glycerol phosphate synthase subunit HisH [Candidatus Omnitrophota bacterium]